MERHHDAHERVGALVTELMQPQHFTELQQVLTFSVPHVLLILKACKLSPAGAELTARYTQQHGVKKCMPLWKHWRTNVAELSEQTVTKLLQMIVSVQPVELLLPLLWACLRKHPSWMAIEGLFEQPAHGENLTASQFKTLCSLNAGCPAPTDPSLLLKIVVVAVYAPDSSLQLSSHRTVAIRSGWAVWICLAWSRCGWHSKVNTGPSSTERSA